MNIDQLEKSARELAFAPTAEKRSLRLQIERRAEESGIFLGSIAPVYRGMASGRYAGFTVPAANLRGLVFDLARAAFQAARAVEAGAFIFEIAPAELSAGRQTFDEYAGVILAAALAEGWRGPLFLQGDHFHLESDDPIALASMQKLCSQAIQAGFYQIDIDASDLEDSRRLRAGERQGANARATAGAINLIRRLAPLGSRVLLGGEVGRIGGELTTERDVRDFLRLVGEGLRQGTRGLGKVSVNTGTQHGGVVDESGRVGRMAVNFELVRSLSEIARREHGLPGIVQHGASTMSLEQMARLPGCGVGEVHLATAIQTAIFSHPAIPRPLLERMELELAAEAAVHAAPEESATDQAGERPATAAKPGRFEQAAGGSTSSPARLGVGRDESTPSAPDASEPGRLSPTLREHGWLAWGRFKAELWDLPAEVRSELRTAAADWFREVFIALNLGGRGAVVSEIAAEARLGAQP